MPLDTLEVAPVGRMVQVRRLNLCIWYFKMLPKTLLKVPWPIDITKSLN